MKWAERLALDESVGERGGLGADQDAARRRFGLQPGGEVGRLADDARDARPRAHQFLRHHHESGVNAYASLECRNRVALDVGIQMSQPLKELQCGPYRAPGVALLGARVADID